MVKLELAHKEVILMLLDYLREHNLLSSMLAVEQETGLSLFKYSNEIHFLRQLILEGRHELMPVTDLLNRDQNEM